MHVWKLFRKFPDFLYDLQRSDTEDGLHTGACRHGGSKLQVVDDYAEILTK